jgi:outer membrane protein OmpA-like peptidoglycan-associated protein
MTRIFLRTAMLAGLSLLLVPAGFANSPAKSKSRKAKKAEAVAEAATVGTKLAAPKAAESSKAEAADAVPAALLAQGGSMQGGGRGSSLSQPAPVFTPMLATSGTLGLFTLETGDTLPKKGFAVSSYVNKFSRMPGSVSVFSIGLDFGIGITDRLTFYGNFQPYVHTHIGDNTQLSLAPPNSFFPQFDNSIYPTLGFGAAPGYVEDFPFAAKNDGGVGEVGLGLKVGLFSERRGAPVSMSIRNEFIIPTRSSLSDLLDNGTQSGQFNDLVSMAISKQWGKFITLSYNAGYRFTRNPRASDGTFLLGQGDQFRTGAGFILFPESRFQPMSEYTGVIFTGLRASTTQDTTFGARDPVDGVWGVRAYLMKNLALDVGYRYMLNLEDAHDRHGFVIKLGMTSWPEHAPPPNRSPTASCSGDKSMVFLDAGDTVTVTGTASDPDNDPLTYTWSASGGRIEGSGPQVRWLSAGVGAGTYTVTLRVDDGRGGYATCSSEIRVEPKPNRPPVMSCAADRTSVFAGERVHITATASDPDGDQLTYTWRANAGQVIGSGAAVDFDTTGLSPGTYSVTGRVDDGHGGAADCTTTIEVRTPPPPPQASKISECLFGRMQSARVDNVCKRILDDVALRMQNEPRATVVIIGYADPRERRPAQLAGDRATNAVKYLGEKGIDASRTSTRAGTGQAGAGNENRRIDVIWVPEGATY